MNDASDYIPGFERCVAAAFISYKIAKNWCDNNASGNCMVLVYLLLYNNPVWLYYNYKTSRLYERRTM